MAAFAKNSDDGQNEVGSQRLSSVIVINDSSFVPSEECVMGFDDRSGQGEVGDDSVGS
jgi:hypothetical protein